MCTGRTPQRHDCLTWQRLKPLRCISTLRINMRLLLFIRGIEKKKKRNNKWKQIWKLRGESRRRKEPIFIIGINISRKSLNIQRERETAEAGIITLSQVVFHFFNVSLRIKQNKNGFQQEKKIPSGQFEYFRLSLDKTSLRSINYRLHFPQRFSLDWWVFL